MGHGLPLSATGPRIATGYQHGTATLRLDRVRARDRLIYLGDMATDRDIRAAGFDPAEYRGEDFEEEAEVPVLVAKRDPRGRKPVPTAVVDIAKSLHAQNASLRAISKALVAAGHLSPSGKPYLAGSVRKMIDRHL